MTHRILLRTIVVDVPSSVHARTRDFWAIALGAHSRRGVRYPEYHVMDDAASRTRFLVQDVGADSARVHIDIETDDVEAEVARLVASGATEVERHDYWAVLRDPAGLLFCVVPAESEDFGQLSRQVNLER